MSEDQTSLRWCKLNRNAMKLFIQDRYGKKISDRMIIFLESNLGTLFRIDYEQFNKLIRDFIKGGPNFYKNFCFFSMNITGNGKLCEHDMF